MNKYSFSSEIFIIGVNPYVPVPDDVVQGLLRDLKKTSGPIPVKGEINGLAFIQTIVKYQGMWRLYINGIMMKASGVSVSDTVTIQVMFDSSNREEKMPESLKVAFQKHTKAKVAFEKLPPYRRKEILRYVNNLKTEESIQRNTEKVIKYLSGEAINGLLVLTYKRS